MRYLLDVNVILALMDPAHVSHADAHAWFAKARRSGWATCPLIQNGVVRIASQPAYANSPGSPSVVAAALAQFVGDSHHEFWPDDVSLLDPRAVDLAKVLRPGDLTDVYLLMLAVRHKGSLATLDQRLKADAVPDGAAHLTRIPVS